MRYLGIDYGTKKVGLALSDEAGTMGFPYGIVQNSDSLLETVAGIIAQEGVGAIVMGESRDFAGAENPVASHARAFAQVLEKRTGISVAYESEIFTSALARRQYAREEKSRATKEMPHVDDSAAAIILTDYLSRPHA